MNTTTEELDNRCFARPQWQQIGEMGDTLTESMTETMNEVWSDYNLDIAQDFFSGGKIADDTLARITKYMKARLEAWHSSHEQEIFDHFAERQ